ncbi:MAG: carboxypeptidase-like regulatory domain-containing protein, partial [Acidobacteriaceae bacterium]
MKNTRGVRARLNVRLCRGGVGWILPVVILALAFFYSPASHAQTTAQLTGTVQDSSGGVIPGAQVTLIDESTGVPRVVQTNSDGLYAFPALVPSSYTLKVAAKGFQLRQITGIVLHAGDARTIPALTLAVGSEATTVTVNAAAEMIPTENGQRNDVIDSKQIENLALEGRDVTELLKVLPGATTESSGLTQNAPMYSDLNVTVQQSAVGNGIDINGAVNRGGTALLADGANVIDPGN